MKGPVNRRSGARGYRTWLIINASLLPTPPHLPQYLLCLSTHTLCWHAAQPGDKSQPLKLKSPYLASPSAQNLRLYSDMSAQQTRTSPPNNAASRPRACKECRQQKVLSLSPTPHHQYKVTSCFIMFLIRGCDPLTRLQLKCDAHLNYSKPCSRCRALGIDCVFTANFKRRKFRPYAAIAPVLVLNS